MNQTSVYQHFRKEEAELIDQVYDWMSQVEERYFSYLTDFLNPREQHIVQSIAGGNEELKLEFYGGYEDAERKRALLSPLYLDVNREDFQLHLLRIDYPKEFIKINHSQILGSVMSLGLGGEKFGDIISYRDEWFIYLDKKISDFVTLELTSIGRHPVNLCQVDPNLDISADQDGVYKEESLTSLRLDTVVAAAFNLSRSKAKDLIASDKVKLNWMTCQNPSEEVSVYDMISVRGFGRVKLQDILGKSKKDKYRVKLLLKSRR